jgi:hypothetical protein
MKLPALVCGFGLLVILTIISGARAGTVTQVFSFSGEIEIPWKSLSVLEYATLDCDPRGEWLGVTLEMDSVVDVRMTSPVWNATDPNSRPGLQSRAEVKAKNGPHWWRPADDVVRITDGAPEWENDRYVFETRINHHLSKTYLGPFETLDPGWLTAGLTMSGHWAWDWKVEYDIEVRLTYTYATTSPVSDSGGASILAGLLALGGVAAAGRRSVV